MQDSDWLTVNTILALLYCSALVFSIWIRSNRTDVSLISLIAFMAIYVAEEAMIGTILGFILACCLGAIAVAVVKGDKPIAFLVTGVAVSLGLVAWLSSSELGLNVLFETLVGPSFFDVMYHAVLFVIIATWATKIAEIGSYLVWRPVVGLLLLEIMAGGDALITAFAHPGESSHFARLYSYMATLLHLITIVCVWSYHNGDSKDRDHDLDHRPNGESRR